MIIFGFSRQAILKTWQPCLTMICEKYKFRSHNKDMLLSGPSVAAFGPLHLKSTLPVKYLLLCGKFNQNVAQRGNEIQIGVRFLI